MMKRFILLALASLVMVGCASNTVKYHPNGQIAEAPEGMALFLAQQQTNIAAMQAEQSFDNALAMLASKLDFKEMAAEAERQIAEVFEERAESVQIREAMRPYAMREFQRPYEAKLRSDVAKRQQWFSLAAIPLGQLPYYIEKTTGGYGKQSGATYEFVDSFNGWSSSGTQTGGPGAPGAIGPNGEMLPGVEGGGAGQQNRPNTLIFGHGNNSQVSGFAPTNQAEKQVFDQGVLQDSDGQVDINLPEVGGPSPADVLEQ